MWQRFTQSARRAIFNATAAAQRTDGGYVGTEHLLVGLVKETTTVASNILRELSVEPESIETELFCFLDGGDHRPRADLTLSPHAKQVIDLAYAEARNLDNTYIGTEHLLLGLIKDGEGLAARFLVGKGIDLERARKAVLAFQQNDSQHEPAGARPSRGEDELPKLHDEAQVSAGPDIRAEMQNLARLTGTMTGDHLCLLLLSEDLAIRKAIEHFGGDLRIVADLIRIKVLIPALTDQPPSGLSASELIPLASAEAISLGQALAPIHVVLAASKTPISATAFALKDAGIAYSEFRHYIEVNCYTDPS